MRGTFFISMEDHKEAGFATRSITLQRYNFFTTLAENKTFYEIVKRSFDITASSFGLIIASPIMLVVTCIIRLHDGGPAIYRQTRIGRYGTEFTIYKFRSMHIDADARLAEMLESDPEIAREYEENAKLKNDPRITRIGKFIRKTSIDELPQLINILRGDMSVVGNRPYMLSEKTKMGKSYDDIISTRPGLTGYWQVSGRNNQNFKNRLELESYYSNNASLRMDSRIFFKTFTTILTGEGAE